MANLRLVWRNLADYATVSASSESYGYEAELVQHPHPWRAWKTGAATAAEWVAWDLYSAQAIQALAVVNHDLTATDSALYVDADSAATFDTDAGSPEFSQAITWRSGVLVEWFAAAQSYRYWRLRFTKASSAYQRSLGRVILGPYDEVTRNPSYGAEWGEVDLSTTRRALDGSSWSDIRGLYRTLRCEFAKAPHAQAELWRNLSHTVGTHTPLLASFDHDLEPVDWLVYGKLTELGGRRLPGNLDDAGGYLWDLTLALAEEV